MRKESGFTLVELILVVAVIAAVTTIGLVNYFGARNSQRLGLAADVLVRELSLTMERSRAQEGSYQWWVHFDNPVGDGNDLYVVCYGTYTASGANCAAEGGTESKRTSLGAGLEFTDPASGVSKDVVFNKATGLPTGTATVIINSTAGAGSKTITINTNGSITF